MDKPITILIPTYNRAQSLRAVWPSYLCSKQVKEIIIVNDGSTDDTSQLIREFSATSIIPVRFIEHPVKMGQQYSRNAAIEAATTEWVLFGEDDVWLDANYCEVLLKEANELRADAIAGRLLVARVPGEFSPDLLSPLNTGGKAPIFDVKNFAANFAASPPAPLSAPYLHSIALIRRSLFGRIGFDTWYKGNAHREETDFYLSLSESGSLVCFTPSTGCYHLRGPISSTGGQRINRVSLEYWHFINTWHLVEKHWDYLRVNCGFHGPITLWMLCYFLRRQYSQLKRILAGNAKSSFSSDV